MKNKLPTSIPKEKQATRSEARRRKEKKKKLAKEEKKTKRKTSHLPQCSKRNKPPEAKLKEISHRNAGAPECRNEAK